MSGSDCFDQRTVAWSLIPSVSSDIRFYSSFSPRSCEKPQDQAPTPSACCRVSVSDITPIENVCAIRFYLELLYIGLSPREIPTAICSTILRRYGCVGIRWWDTQIKLTYDTNEFVSQKRTCSVLGCDHGFVCGLDVCSVCRLGGRSG